MARRTADGGIGTVGQTAIGGVLGALVAAQWAGWPVWLGAAAGVLVVYLVSCWRWPYARCPWCRGRSTARGDGSGHFRRKRPCRVCGGEDFPRLGARVLGRG